MNDLEKRLAELQDLCGRAYSEIDENWDSHTVDGYGPSSLLKDLKAAAGGKEIKQLTALNNKLIKICNEQADKIKQYESEKEENRKSAQRLATVMTNLKGHLSQED